ncbi:MAG: helix-turn-helix transcriptional regulator [Myxococcales bacterium]|nr:helix-turn-helix transcriptional regulator [Myxococcales bacterium]
MKRSRVTADLTPKSVETCREPHGPRVSRPVDPRALEAAAGFFRAAGDAARLRILTELRDGERCVSDLAAASEDGMSTMSQRLKVLRAEGLVRRRRDGKHILYALADAHVLALVDTALAHAEDHRKETP